MLFLHFSLRSYSFSLIAESDANFCASATSFLSSNLVHFQFVSFGTIYLQEAYSFAFPPNLTTLPVSSGSHAFQISSSAAMLNANQ